MRYSDYARLLTNIANTYRNKGNFKSADSAFAMANGWIDKNLGESSIVFVQNQYNWSNLIVEGGLEASQNFPRGTGYDQALNNLKISHKPSHYLGIEIYEQYLKRLLQEESPARYNNTKLEFEKMIKYQLTKWAVDTLEFDCTGIQININAIEIDTKFKSATEINEYEDNYRPDLICDYVKNHLLFRLPI